MVWGFFRAKDHFCSSTKSKVTPQNVGQVWLLLVVFYLRKKIQKNVDSAAILPFYVVKITQKSKQNEPGQNAQDSLVFSKLRYCALGFCEKIKSWANQKLLAKTAYQEDIMYKHIF